MKNLSSLVKTRILFFSALISAAFVSLSSNQAATITVTNTNDSGPGSLRQALADANNGDTVNFSVTGRIALTSGQLIVDKSVTILGPGANLLTVAGIPTQIFRISHVGLGYRGPCPGPTVVIQGLTIRDGSENYGGGIYFSSDCGAGGTLTVEHCTFNNNAGASGGGAIINRGGSLIVNDSTISGNVGNDGGGIYNGPSRQLIVNNCTISDNVDILGSGGGIFNQGNATINNSTVSGNTSGGGGGNGAGIFSYSYLSSKLIVNNSTISGNNIPRGGRGAIFIQQDPRSRSVSVVSNSTISSDGDCIYSQARLTIGGTILQRNGSGGTIVSAPGLITSLGYNLSNDNGGGYLTGPGDLINRDPLLGLLQDNGGPTLTRALLPGSPAVDMGNPSFTPPPDHDQRGCPFLRVYNGRIDIGSFEVQPPPPRPCSTPRPQPTATPRA
jgi:hypothetical protein